MLRWGLGVLVAMTLAGAAQADHHKGDKGERWKKMSTELGLTDAQVKRAQDIRGKYKASLRDKREASKAAKEALKEAMADGNQGKDALLQKFDAAQQARTAYRRERFSMMLEMRENLTPEQRAKFRQGREERGEKRRGRKGR